MTVAENRDVLIGWIAGLQKGTSHGSQDRPETISGLDPLIPIRYQYLGVIMTLLCIGYYLYRFNQRFHRRNSNTMLADASRNLIQTDVINHRQVGGRENTNVRGGGGNGNESSDERRRNHTTIFQNGRIVRGNNDRAGQQQGASADNAEAVRKSEESSSCTTADDSGSSSSICGGGGSDAASSSKQTP